MKTLKAIIFLGLSLLVSCSPDISKSIGNMVKLNNAFRTDLADQPKVSLSGRIINLESNKPVNNCVVYLENTTFKSSVNDKGEFRFNNIPLADYSLIIIPDEGTFFSKKIDLTEHPDSNYVIYIKLPEQKANNDIFSPQEKVTILEKELEAQKKKSEKREKDIISKLSDLLSDKGYETYTIFMKTIIGHPSDCKILNPQVLSFETHENSGEQWITCKTSAPIILLNKWLGYIQIIDLKKASITKSSGYYTISYDADICYDDILNSQDYKPDSAYCLSNRLNSFKGSTQHFFMSLAAGKLDKEGFLVSEPKVQQATQSRLVTPNASSNNNGSQDIEIDNLNKIVSQNGNRYEFILHIPGVLKVIYLNAIPSGNDLIFKGIEKVETSYVMVFKNPFVFYSNGTFKDKREITASGYWTIKRISEKLPTNYLTSHKNSKTTN